MSALVGRQQVDGRFGWKVTSKVTLSCWTAFWLHQRPAGVFLGDDRDRQRPGDAEFRVVPTETVFAQRRGATADVVEDFGVVGQGLKAGRYVRLPHQRSAV